MEKIGVVKLDSNFYAVGTYQQLPCGGCTSKFFIKWFSGQEHKKGLKIGVRAVRDGGQLVGSVKHFKNHQIYSYLLLELDRVSSFKGKPVLCFTNGTAFQLGGDWLNVEGMPFSKRHKMDYQFVIPTRRFLKVMNYNTFSNQPEFKWICQEKNIPSDYEYFKWVREQDTTAICSCHEIYKNEVRPVIILATLILIASFLITKSNFILIFAVVFLRGGYYFKYLIRGYHQLPSYVKEQLVFRTWSFTNQYDSNFRMYAVWIPVLTVLSIALMIFILDIDLGGLDWSYEWGNKFHLFNLI
jgi:hypothetical protein